MKKSILFLASLIASVALTSCNKEQTDNYYFQISTSSFSYSVSGGEEDLAFEAVGDTSAPYIKEYEYLDVTEKKAISKISFVFYEMVDKIEDAVGDNRFINNNYIELKCSMFYPEDKVVLTKRFDNQTLDE